ncbi:MAG: hypothetical protein QME81_18750, partial [bacterium]|nr:hypothetical protein [bacterium]
MNMLFSILKFEKYQEGYTCCCCYPKCNKKIYLHLQPPSSFGVMKYASRRNIMKNIPIPMLDSKEYLPDKILPITPAVSVYLAASPKILPIIFLRSLFMILFHPLSFGLCHFMIVEGHHIPPSGSRRFPHL